MRERRLISQADDKRIVEQVVKAAKANQPEAWRVYFRHLRPPPPKATYVGPFAYTAPQNPEEARTLLLQLAEKLSRNEITIEVYDALLNGLRTYLADQTAEQRKMIEELDARLERLAQSLEQLEAARRA